MALFEEDSLKYVLEHIDELVVKEVHGSGGYGMLAVRPPPRRTSGLCRKAEGKPPITSHNHPVAFDSADPRENGVAPRHVDLRPYVLVSKTVKIIPGGLTRVALKEGSLVVNSSQGGGTRTPGSGGLRNARTTANGLYWMFPYIERAENIARLIDAGFAWPSPAPAPPTATGTASAKRGMQQAFLRNTRPSRIATPSTFML